jgi:hypothetical protein
MAGESMVSRPFCGVHVLLARHCCPKTAPFCIHLPYGGIPVTTHTITRLLITLTAVTLVAAAVAASPVQAQAPLPPDTYLGISADAPTGSPAIGLDGLVAAYDMATVTPDGLLHDFSGQQHHGTLLQTPLVPGLFGLARQFATTDDAIDLPEPPTLALNGPLSLALWVRVDQLGLHQHLLACDAQFTLWITPDNHIRFADTLGHGFESVDALAPATWYSLVAVFSGTAGEVLTADNIAVFLNGQPVAGEIFGQWSPGGLHAQDACYIGFESLQGEPAHQELPFVGAIDELLIFSRALTLPEIAVHARPHP